VRDKGSPGAVPAFHDRAAPDQGKLSLAQLWQRARGPGATMPDQSTVIVRRDRDARRGR